jgi:hypothetical protein
VVFVPALVPEVVVDFVMFREMDVLIMVTPVEVTFDAVVEVPIVVLGPRVVDVTLVVVVERPVLVLEPLVVDVTLDVVVEGPVVEVEEVVASVQLLEAKAATPSANADSKGAANVTARD